MKSKQLIIECVLCIILINTWTVRASRYSYLAKDILIVLHCLSNLFCCISENSLFMELSSFPILQLGKYCGQMTGLLLIRVDTNSSLPHFLPPLKLGKSCSIQRPKFICLPPCLPTSLQGRKYVASFFS